MQGLRGTVCHPGQSHRGPESPEVTEETCLSLVAAAQLGTGPPCPSLPTRDPSAQRCGLERPQHKALTPQLRLSGHNLRQRQLAPAPGRMAWYFDPIPTPITYGNLVTMQKKGDGMPQGQTPS